MPVVEAKRVAVLGAAGGIGQPLSLLLKMNKCVSELALYDVAPLAKGVAADLSHCNTPVQVGAPAAQARHARGGGLAGADQQPQLPASGKNTPPTLQQHSPAAQQQAGASNRSSSSMPQACRQQHAC